MNLKDVVEFIITDASVDTAGINSIIRAVRERQKISRSMERAVAQSTLRVGMSVRLEGLAPKYWNGTEGIIVKFNQTRTRADIRITQSSHSGKITVGLVRNGFPLTCLKPIGIPASTITNDDADALIEFMGG